MRRITRRAAMGSMGLACAGASGLLSSVARALPVRSAPEEPLRLSREIALLFHDQTQMTVFRSWTIQFRPEHQGSNVFGEADQVAIESSPELAALADREAARSTAGMWPIRLSSAGLILAIGSGDDETSDSALPSSAALLENLSRFDAADLKHPFPGVLAWATPLPDTAMSIAFEYEPPPPRA